MLIFLVVMIPWSAFRVFNSVSTFVHSSYDAEARSAVFSGILNLLVGIWACYILCHL